LLSARQPVSPAAFLTPEKWRKMAKNAKYAFCVAMSLGSARQAAGEILTGKLGLPERALLLSPDRQLTLSLLPAQCCFVLLNQCWGIIMYGHGASS